MPEPYFNLEKMDRTVGGRATSHEELAAADRAYVWSLTPLQRLQMLEFLRKQHYGLDSTERLQRVCGLSKRPQR